MSVSFFHVSSQCTWCGPIKPNAYQTSSVFSCTYKTSVVIVPCAGTRPNISHLFIGWHSHSEDRFVVGHRAAIIKIWLTFEKWG